MAILAESVVEEWLNRQRFFTIRGAKTGRNEMDVLAVRQEPSGHITGWHVEVQVSFRPIGYIAPWKGHSIATRRTEQVMADCVQKWVEKKFLAENIRDLRKRLWGQLEWSFHLVHGVVRYPDELELMRSHRVTLHPFFGVLESLCAGGDELLTASSGGDMADIIRYYERTKHQSHGPANRQRNAQAD